jgi:hypothetical protein
LDRLYVSNNRLRVELESLFNFLFGPTKFEKAWNEMVKNMESRSI